MKENNSSGNLIHKVNLCWKLFDYLKDKEDEKYQNIITNLNLIYLKFKCGQNLSIIVLYYLLYN
jgi:ribosomal protein S15P/S13E